MAENKTTRNVVVAGGAIALLLLLFRGSGWGLGGSGGPSHSGDGWLGFGQAADPYFVVFVRERFPPRYGLPYFTGSTVADTRSRSAQTLHAVVEQAQLAVTRGSRVVVGAEGRARQGDVDELMRALARAGVRFEQIA